MNLSLSLPMVHYILNTVFASNSDPSITDAQCQELSAVNIQEQGASTVKAYLQRFNYTQEDEERYVPSLKPATCYSSITWRPSTICNLQSSVQ
ncbi:hypothetical protein DSO57_1036605 [Entomophthora muscae]|uniref:Uncharacterized protein n=1 Tax=Entomophthora muscae TaxID=34485 RepID=A0ACC2T9W9_9FUNG|nr:hypothetical protein DSO57_1036605 [Entomophthora muscae]